MEEGSDHQAQKKHKGKARQIVSSLSLFLFPFFSVDKTKISR
jgi:hypothetical protein